LGGFGEFARFYTGKVVATLNGNQKHSMRCRFTLTNPTLPVTCWGLSVSIFTSASAWS
jgi:hypothetical protein